MPSREPTTLRSSEEPLDRRYDLAMLDLDGVVYVGASAVPGAPEHVATARTAGMRIAFVTNNASRPPQAVVEQLRELGVDTGPDDVVTSAQAAASVLRGRLAEGAPVVVLGGPGLVEAVSEAGLARVGVDEQAEAVVTGYGADVLWGDIMRAAVRIKDGLWWVASNTDGTFPTSFGVAPGHGVLVETLRRFTGVDPVVAGKPSRPLIDETVRRCGAERPLMVGDRLDTDILGARTAGIDSLLVLTGVTGLPELVAAEPELRPTYLSSDLAGLDRPQPAPEIAADTVSLGGWTARVDKDELAVDGTGSTDDWWRVVAVAAWRHLDEAGEPVTTAGVEPPG